VVGFGMTGAVDRIDGSSDFPANVRLAVEAQKPSRTLSTPNGDGVQDIGDRRPEGCVKT
jgi:hypothetical protein